MGFRPDLLNSNWASCVSVFIRETTGNHFMSAIFDWFADHVSWLCFELEPKFLNNFQLTTDVMKVKIKRK